MSRARSAMQEKKMQHSNKKNPAAWKLLVVEEPMSIGSRWMLPVSHICSRASVRAYCETFFDQKVWMTWRPGSASGFMVSLLLPDVDADEWLTPARKKAYVAHANDLSGCGCRHSYGAVHVERAPPSQSWSHLGRTSDQLAATTHSSFHQTPHRPPMG